MDLLINTYGTRIRSSGERIVLVFPTTKKRKEYSVHRIKKIIILRPSSISTEAVQLALENDIDIVYLGSFEKPVGRLFPSTPKGLAQLRLAQLETATSEKALRLAAQFVLGKGSNQILFLKQLQNEYNKSFSTSFRFG
jgi:CRISPR-associated protein Cas1